MPIEFTCTGCGRMLRTPDQSAGKKAKCPQCSAIVDVPLESAAPQQPTPAPTEPPTPDIFAPSPFSDPGSSDSPFSDSTIPPKPAAFSDPANPYASPSLDAVKPDPHGTSSASRPGLPWETDGKSLGSFWATAKLIAGSPTTAFMQMRQEGGLGDPILYGMAGGLIGNLAAAIYASLLQGGMFALMGVAGSGQMGAEEQGMMLGVMGFQIVMNFVQAIIGGTVGVLIWMFVSAGIIHLFLMLFKGANQPFETTFRTRGFVMGATAMFNVIPFVGGLVAMITGLIYTILGLAAAHDTTTGKAAGAIFAPMIVCCVVVVGVPMGGLIFWLISEGNL